MTTAAANPTQAETEAETEAETQAGADLARALILVDIQNDFCEGGSLAVAGGHAVASAATAFLEKNADLYAAVIATRDNHTDGCSNGGHFAEPGTAPDFVDTWPVHCVENSAGADYAPQLSLRHVTHHIAKGMGVPAYSGFEGVTADGTRIVDILDPAATAVDICGLATDYCVKATALDAARAGYAQVRVLLSMCAAVNPAGLDAVVAELTAAGVVVIDTPRTDTPGD